MTLEIGPTPIATSTQDASDASPTKTKTQGGGSAHGGFMAILAALGHATGAAPGADDALDPAQQGMLADAKTKGSHGKSAPLHAGTDLPKTGKGVDTGEATLTKSWSDTDTGKPLPSSAADGASLLGGSPVGLTPPTLPADTTALLAQSAQWSATTGGVVATTADAAKSMAGGAVTDALAAAKVAHPLVKTDEPAVATVVGDASAVASARLAKSQKDATTRLAGANAELATQAGATANAQVDPKVIQAMPKPTEIPMAAIATAMAAVGTAVSGRREDGGRERAGFRTNASDGAGSAQTYQPTASGAAPQNAVDAPSPTDTFVAEKVAYWISNDVQNAQMKLDGLGDKPVEVSIRMQGNEAHIAFRTDELQAQAALENASTHLKDLLQREGLVLSGVSVGSSGAGGAGGAGDQQPGSRQGVRQAVVSSAPVPSGTVRSAGVGRAAGSALDLFV